MCVWVYETDNFCIWASQTRTKKESGSVNVWIVYVWLIYELLHIQKCELVHMSYHVKKECENVLSSMRSCHHQRQTWVSERHLSLVLSCQSWYCQCVNHWFLECIRVPLQHGEMTLAVMYYTVGSNTGLVSLSANDKYEWRMTRSLCMHVYTHRNVMCLCQNNKEISWDGWSEWACVDIWLTVNLRES